MRSTRTPEALEALKKEIGELIDRIEAATEYEPHESPLCDWCPYWDLCPVKKHLVEAYISTEKRYTVTLKEESQE